MTISSLKIAILTTNTPHHCYFVQEVINDNHEVLVLEETSHLSAPFDTRHSFENQRDHYEYSTFFQDRWVNLREIANTKQYPSINSPEAITTLTKFNADLIFVFGTGKLSAEVIAVSPNNILNFHGGDPNEYRGLDTHLWAIYHKDFAGLVVTLHRVVEGLDLGEIIAQAPIAIPNGLALHQLRGENAKTCVELFRKTCKTFSEDRVLKGTPLSKRGRYYSFMPSVMKESCVKNFAAYTRRLR